MTTASETAALRWYALYTKGRHEKCVNEELQKNRVESFLPLRRIRRRWSDRSVLVEEPLFKSYLFVKMSLSETQKVLRSKGAVGLVSSQARPVVVQDSVIDSLKKIIASEISIDPFPYLSVGDKVFVRSGIFKGMEGLVVRKDDQKCRLVISISAIQASISFEVDAFLVEKI